MEIGRVKIRDLKAIADVLGVSAASILARVPGVDVPVTYEHDGRLLTFEPGPGGTWNLLDDDGDRAGWLFRDAYGWLAAKDGEDPADTRYPTWMAALNAARVTARDGEPR